MVTTPPQQLRRLTAFAVGLFVLFSATAASCVEGPRSDGRPPVEPGERGPIREPEPEPEPAPPAAPGPIVDPALAPVTPPPSSPMFWTWQEPLGAARRARIIKMVRQNTHRAPEVVADRICDEIVRRRLRQGEVAIILQGFGMGGDDPSVDSAPFPALFRHRLDGLSSRAAAKQWWMTVWMRRGIAECREWMQRFIDRYQMRQARDARIPDPWRFHFDSEKLVVPHYTARGTVEAFAAMKRDPRWAQEAVPGHDGKTLARLYEEAGRPPCDPNQSWGNGSNRPWGLWFAGVCYQAADGAMDEAAYSLIRQTWPRCKSSNYDTSDHYDGQGDPPRVRPGSRYPWFRYHHRAFAELQAPVLYHRTDQNLVRGDETAEEAAVRIARETIDANIHSFGGGHTNLAPWIETTGNIHSFRGRKWIVSKRYTRDLLALLRSRAVSEYLVWSSDTTQKAPRGWNDFADCVRQVWAIDVHAFVVTTGDASTGDVDRLRYGRKEGIPIRSSPSTVAGHEVRMRVTLQAGFVSDRQREGIAIVMESEADRDGIESSIAVWNRSTAVFERLGTSPIGRRRVVQQVRGGPVASYLDGEDRLELEIVFRSPAPFTTTVDLIQAVLEDR